MGNAIHLVEMNAKISNRNETTVIWKQGMTLVEVLMAVAIIGLLAALLFPSINRVIRSRENAQCASHLRAAMLAFTMYRSETGSYPPDKYPGQIPPEMIAFFAELNIDDWWSQPTELGGQWDWDNGYNFKYSVSISNPTAGTEQLAEFDRLIDDGNLDTGNFRKIGTHYHYIIEK